MRFQCDECKLPVESAEKIENHMKKKQVEFRCEDCKLRTDRMDKMNDHRKKKHESIRLKYESNLEEKSSEEEIE